MNKSLILDICESRMLVGFLGEKTQASWWGCSFLSPSSTAFLAPVYPNSIVMAQYSGICRAAALIHDEHIGIGKHYHLYRMPDSIERKLLKHIQEKDLIERINKNTSTQAIALDRLKALGSEGVEKTVGPVTIGVFADADLDKLLKTALSNYWLAFDSGYKTFPYMKCL